MQYMGGKARLARRIAAEIIRRSGGRSTFYEPFLGGAHILPLVSHAFARNVGSDLHADLAMLWAAARDGWTPPGEVNREEWYRLKDSEPSALRGFVGFGCSFGGRWFEGYARKDPRPGRVGACRASREGVLRKAAGLQGCEILRSDYRELCPGSDSTVYADPPYEGTKPYSGMPRFDTDEFWTVMEKWAGWGALVLVSGYSAPAGWEVALEFPVKVSINKDTNSRTATEKLFVRSIGGPA